MTRRTPWLIFVWNEFNVLAAVGAQARPLKGFALFGQAYLFHKAGADDPCGKGEHAYPEKREAGGHNLSSGGYWEDVTVPDGGEGDNGPPHRGGDARELIRLRVVFGDKNDDCGNQDQKRGTGRKGWERFVVD